ncbi:glycosyltransferase family 2 protein [Pedobacter cryoconitis]|uniref:Glycosyl transferase family 2 n=1 Tax=Pedobacter cryoconitis TaxID=188932 RepID=A0A327S935_9SPHI|nr:glycosyltransferase family 2 protein [Pedobacter cryoconitis]RAJ25580.1 hypothetical protein LY11_04084 [Pedobacter cryoconitis]
MADRISVALVISTYNWPEALKLVLESVLKQTILPDEIVIADDGSGKETYDLIRSYTKRFNIPVKHFWHEDNGFQKTIILNQAVLGTASTYIVQIDGDIILEEHFIEDHLNAAEQGYHVLGSRGLLTVDKSKELLNGNSLGFISAFSKGINNGFNIIRFPLVKSFFVTKRKRSNNFKGCNCAFWKADFLKVNGYNNGLTGWGHEDIELGARFINLGITQKKIKMVAICYHIYHKINDRGSEKSNYKVYQQTVNDGNYYCENGCDKMEVNAALLK